MSDREKEEMFLKNKIYIYWYIKKLGLKSMGEELYGAGLLGLVSAINSYDPNKPNKENTYFTKCIINNINRYLYLQNMPKRKNDKKIVSLDKPINNYENCSLLDVISSDDNVEEIVENKERINILMEVINELSSSDKNIILKYFGINCDRMNEREIAKEYNVSKQAISYKKNRILKILKNKLIVRKFEF